MSAVLFYSMWIFQQAGVANDVLQYVVLGTSAVTVVATAISIPLIDMVGRRKMLLVPLIAMLLSIVLLTISIVEVSRYDTWTYTDLAIKCPFVTFFKPSALQSLCFYKACVLACLK